MRVQYYYASYTISSIKDYHTFITTTNHEKTTANAYSIGTPGQPWGKAEYKQWKDTRIKERCYHTNVVPAVQALSDKYDVIEYGKLSNDDEKYFPLFAVRSKEWSDDKPNVFITGGVHGYETVSSYVFVGVLCVTCCGV